MTIRDRLFDRFFGDIHERRVDARVEALRAASSRDKQVEGFRRLTDSDRDLSPLTHDKQREIAVYLYLYNPFARRILETIREWILGEGVSVTSEHPKTSVYLERFWTDRTNRWDIRLWEQTLELFLMGERFWPVFPNQFDGLMRFGVLDPSKVKEIILNPDNVEQPLGVILKGDAGMRERRMRAVLTAEDMDILTGPALSLWEGLEDGELFPIAINKLSTQSRGISELFSMADWLDGYEQLLFSILQREKANAYTWWDVKLEGYSDEQIEAWLTKQGYPKPGGIRAHNEKVEWNFRTAEGSATNNTEHARLFRNHVLGSVGIPEHWYGGGGDVNRASAAEMGTPAEKSFTAKQRTVKHILEDVVRAQVDRAVQVGGLPDDDEAREFTVEFPEPSTRDLSKIASGIQSIAGGLVLFGREGWVDDETSVQVLASLLQQMGIERDPEEMLERAKAQRADRLADEAIDAITRRTAVEA